MARTRVGRRATARPCSRISAPAATRLGQRANIFGSVLVGIDGSPEALEAARQASALGEGRLVLLAAYSIAAPLVGGTAPSVPAYYDEERQRSEAERMLAQAHGESERLASAEGRIARGTSWDELIREVEREQHTLVVVGSHGQGRIRGIVLGSTATELVHKAPCSVLVARQADSDFPRRIVVGVDGSPESATAYAVARHFSERFSAELRPVVARGGESVDEQLVAKIVDDHEDLPDEPVQALVSAAADADLVVVGSRGLHGIKALGSVSERVAHRVHCSTLVVREPHRQREAEGAHALIGEVLGCPPHYSDGRVGACPGEWCPFGRRLRIRERRRCRVQRVRGWKPNQATPLRQTTA